MKTTYRPTQMRGKRVVFRSIDPSEEPRATKNQLIFGIIMLGLFGLGLLLNPGK